MGNEVTVVNTAIAKINHPDYIKALASVLPRSMPVNRFLAIAIAEIQSPSLSKVTDPISVIVSVYNAAKLGLSLNKTMGEGYLVPFNKSFKRADNSWGKECLAQFMPGYQGLAKLVTNGGKVKFIKGQPVTDKDKFRTWSDDQGDHVEYEPCLTERGALIAAFSQAVFTDGTVSYKVLPGYKIQSIKEAALSKTQNTGPWLTHEDEMWAKTAVRAHCKSLPKSESLALAVSYDESFETGKFVDVPSELIGGGIVDASYQTVLDQHSADVAPQSTKPDVTPTMPINPPAATASNPPKVRDTTCISEGQEKRLYAIMKAKNVDIVHLKAWLKKHKQVEHLSDIKKGPDYERVCKTLEEQPDFFQSDFNASSAVPAQVETPAAPVDTWIDDLRAAALKAKFKTDVEIAKELSYFGVNDANNVTEEQKKEIIKHFNGLAELG